MLFPRNGGTYSGPRKQFAAASPAGNRRIAREPVTEILYASAYWRAPDTFAGMIRLDGRGGDGAQGGSYPVQQYHENIVMYQYRRNGTVEPYYYSNADYPGTTTNTTHCDPPVYYDGTDFSHSQICFEYYDSSYEEYYDSTVGADSAAFGAVFPGGYAEAATAVVRDPATNIEPGKQYVIQVAPGGYVRMIYYK